MNKFNRTAIFGSIAAVILLVSLIVVAAAQTGSSPAAASQPQSAVVQAQSAAPANATPGTNVTTTITDTNTYYNIYLQNLATSLGVSKDKLTQSMTQAAKDTIAQAVKDGKLTQAQADSLDQRIDQMAQKGRYGFGGFGPIGRKGGPEMRGPEMGAFAGLMQQVAQAVATKLGITVDQLKSDLQGGQTLADIAKSKNVSVADLKTVIINTIKPTLDQAVKDGKLTQAQEDSIIQRIQNADFTKKGFGFGFGPGGFGHRGMGGPGFGGPGSNNPSNGNPGNGTNG